MALQTITVSASYIPDLITAANAQLATLTAVYIRSIAFQATETSRISSNEVTLVIVYESGAAGHTAYQLNVFAAQQFVATANALQSFQNANPSYWFGPSISSSFNESRRTYRYLMCCIYNTVLADGQTYYVPGGTGGPAGGGGSGSVTSVGLALPSIFTVTGSPVTVAGTLTGTLAAQTANQIFAGPTSGGAVAPTFRALVGADYPALTVPIGSINATGTPSATTFLRGDGSWTVSGGGGVSGSGTAGTHAKWATSSSLTNSLLSEATTTVTLTGGATSTNTSYNSIASINDFLQYDIQNTSTGTNAQTTYSITADNGTATTGFMSINICNSTFTAVNAYSIGVANDCSVLASGNDLYVANANVTKDIIFSTGKVASPFFDERLRIQNAAGVGGMLATLGGSLVVQKAATNDAIALAGRAGGVGSFVGTMTVAALTASRTYTFPDASMVVGGSASALTAGQVVVAQAGGLLGGSAGFTFAANILTLGVSAAGGNNVFRANGDDTAVKGFQIQRNGLNRWLLFTQNAETGGNVGSDIYFRAYDDAGTTLTDVWQIVRAAGGAFAVARPLSVTGTLTVSTLTSGRVPFASTAGLLIDAPSLTYASNLLTVGDATGNTRIVINGAATSSQKNLYFQTAGVLRWEVSVINNEAGSDTGSQFYIGAHNDAGALIDYPINIFRIAGGAITLARPTNVLYNSAQVVIGNGVGAPRILVDGAAGSARFYNVRTGGSTRWQWGADASTESGANAGSAWQLNAYDDTATLIDTPLTIVRAAGGAISTPRPVSIGFTPAPLSGNLIAIATNTAYAPSGATSANYFGADLRVTSNVAANGGQLFGAWVRSQLTASATGTYAGVSGGQAEVNNASLAVITVATGFRVNAATNSGGGSITTNIGLDVAAQTVGVTNYAIRTSTGMVRFGDNVGLGLDPVASAGLIQTSIGTTIASGILLGDVGVFRSAANAVTINATAGTTLTGSLTCSPTIATNAVTVQPSITALSGTIRAGIFQAQYAPSGATTATFVGCNGLASTNVAANGGNLQGMAAEARFASPATGTYASGIGIAASVNNQSTTIVTLAQTVLILSPQNTGGGSITTNIGLDVQAQTAGTTNFAIRTSTGIVSIGDTTSASSSIVGAFLVGNGTAATNVAIGAGNINAGGSGTFGGNSQVVTNSSSQFSLDTTAAGAANPSYNFKSSGTIYWQYGFFGGTGDKSFFIYDPIAATSPLTIASGAGGILGLTRPITITPPVVSSGVQTALLVTGAANTGMTASTEVIDARFNLARTVQWATGALATQRAFLVQAPTYAFIGASTITNAATVAITGAPVAGTNATLTNTWALWIQAGALGLAAATTTNTSLNMPHGVAPTTPINGDMWTTIAGLFLQVNGATVGPFASGVSGSGTTNSVTVWSGVSSLTSLTAFTATNATIAYAQTAQTSGTASMATWTGGAHTNLTLSTEVIDVNYALNRTVQFATGALATQRALVVQAPTYAFVAGSTITNAATFAITNAPVAGTNATLTNAWALWVQAGASRFDGQINAAGTQLSGATAMLNIAPATVAASGTPKLVLYTGAANTNMTLSTEVNDVNYNLARTVQWATGAIATQRAVVVQAPTYAFVGASTITTAATFAVSGAPVAGTNATLTTALALWVQAGNVLFAGNLTVTTNATITGTLTQTGTATFSNFITSTGTQVNGATAQLNIAPATVATGTPKLALFTGAANTNLTLSTEVIDVNVNLARTVQWATGAIATQRAVAVQAPTYAFVGASTITNAATFAITGAPVAGTNATLTNSWALWVQGGASRFDGQINAAGTQLSGATAMLNIAPATVAASGTPLLALFTGAANTNMTLSTEVIDVNVNLNRTVQWATGALATQRAMVVQAPTYAFVGASTITNAATFAITGAPVAGANATLTNTWSLWVQAGASRFDGQINAAGTQVSGATAQLNIAPATVAASGTPKLALFTGAANTNMTLSTEVNDITFALNRIVQWATGAIAIQRAAVVQAPTYSFVAASTITQAATFAITGAPVVGTNATLTASYALWVQAGLAALDGGINIGVAGGGIAIKEGSNAASGVVTLVAGTAIVSTTKVTANTRIYLSVQALGTVTIATPVAVVARTGGTSFSIASSAGTDTSVVSWLLIEPAP